MGNYKKNISIITIVILGIFKPAFCQLNSLQEYTLTIKTYHKGTNTKVKSILELKDISSEDGFQGKGQTNAEGFFSFKLSGNAILKISTTSPGYMPTTTIVNPNKDNLKTKATIRIELTKIEVGTLIQLENVKFNRGKYELLPESYNVLNDLAKLLYENEKIKIELAGHTDAIGGTQTNLKLSEKRVEAVKSYLVGMGIKTNRIKGVGYGGKRPIAKNNNEEGRERNRRVEFKVLKIE